jgi:hypothetical protein
MPNTVIALPSEEWGKAMTSRRYGFDFLLYVYCFICFFQVEAILEDFERRAADSEDKDAVCTNTLPRVFSYVCPRSKNSVAIWAEIETTPFL